MRSPTLTPLPDFVTRDIIGKREFLINLRHLRIASGASLTIAERKGRPAAVLRRMHAAVAVDVLPPYRGPSG